MNEPMNQPQTDKVICSVCQQEFDTQEQHDKHHREAHPEDQPGSN